MNEQIKQMHIDGLKENKILGFYYHYRYLSNFHICDVNYNGFVFPSTEHAYQAMKSTDENVWKKFADKKMTPSMSKKIGQTIVMREDWNEIKYKIMHDVCKIKFTDHEELRENLLDTKDMYLEETNWWNDRYWGTHFGVGENNLGKILMKIREELAQGKKNV